MGPELLSTARPTRLRLAGFLALEWWGRLVARGSLRTWATVRPFRTGTAGIDLWEGELTLALGLSVLVGVIVMRMLAAPGPDATGARSEPGP
ncbi:MAG TPA: hypothetical protein VE646_10400 [Actinomycetota bacterium]|nr:hypothetical protein [Actinomycetota bacterium]